MIANGSNVWKASGLREHLNDVSVSPRVVTRSGKIRVLIVDDSVVIRKILTDALSAAADIEVVGTAANGKIALAKVPQVNPDIITLDIEMPELDGIQTLAELRKSHGRLPVIMFSTLTERGAAATLEALTLGANDYVTKPANVGSITAGLQKIEEDLIPKIRALCGQSLVMHSDAKSGADETMAHGELRGSLSTGLNGTVKAVVIGVSTGGPNALAALLPEIPRHFPVPILIVQHMPPVFTKLLAERLASKSNVKVREATAGERLEPGVALIAPGDFHMEVVQKSGVNCVQLHQGPPENSCRPAVDVLFRSAAQVFGSNLLAVMLTGMGQDGLRGCECINARGGRVLAQDERTSVVWGMPGFVVKAGLASDVLPLGMIGPKIRRIVPS